jgi:hypothetical protein
LEKGQKCSRNDGASRVGSVSRVEGAGTTVGPRTSVGAENVSKYGGGSRDCGRYRVVVGEGSQWRQGIAEWVGRGGSNDNGVSRNSGVTAEGGGSRDSIGNMGRRGDRNGGARRWQLAATPIDGPSHALSCS